MTDAAMVNSAEVDSSSNFYVVGPKKMLLLYFATFGMYKLYWVYKQWATYKRATNSDLWPVPRAIFSVFFTHALFEQVSLLIKHKRIDYRWNSQAAATTYVVATIGAALVSRLPRELVGAHGSFAILLGTLLVISPLLHNVQSAINVACEQPGGVGNRRLTWLNYLWVALGAVFWFFSIAGFMR